jgi:hypothetical protein
MTPLMQKGVKQYISEQDLPALLPSDESENLGSDLEIAMAKQCELLINVCETLDNLLFIYLVRCGKLSLLLMADHTPWLPHSRPFRIVWLSSSRNSFGFC